MQPCEDIPPEKFKLLSDLLSYNGISSKEATAYGTYPHVESLEMFFFGVPEMFGFQYFPNLTKLCIMNQNVRTIKCLDHCRQLRELWICETKIKRIEGIRNCSKLEYLYLYSNSIKKIENISHATNLRTLWLSNNSIRKLDGLSSLTQLLDLNIACNNIEIIGDSLNNNSQLTSLNISGNPIFSLETLRPLRNFQCMVILSLADPQYRASPIAKMLNYVPLMLYHFPRLRQLDNVDIDVRMTNNAADILNNKLMYYKIKARMLSRQYYRLISKLEDTYKRIFSPISEKYRFIKGYLNTLELLEDKNMQNKFELDFSNEALLSICSKEIRLNADNSLKQIKEITETLQTEFTRVLKMCCETFNLACLRLNLEYSTGGSIRVLPGDNKDPWYQSCISMIPVSVPAIMAKFNVIGVDVKAVYQIQNPMLHYNFENSLLDFAISEDKDENVVSSNITDMIEYLYLVCSPEFNKNDVIADICQHGLSALKHSKDEYPQLISSLYEADLPRVIYKTENSQITEIKRTQVLLCKVFYGRVKYVKSIREIKKKDSKIYTAAIISQSITEDDGVIVYCDNTKHCALLNPHFAVPEYLITIEYRMTTDCTDLLSVDYQQIISDTGFDSSRVEDINVSLNDVLLKVHTNKLSNIKSIKPFNLIEMKMVSLPILDNITNLFLPSCKIRSIGFLTKLTSIQYLCICNNNISDISDISYCTNLIMCDVSYNKIPDLVSLRKFTLNQLDELILAYNTLSDLETSLLYIQQAFPNITDLNLLGNPFAFQSPYFDFNFKPTDPQLNIVLHTLPTLNKFNAQLLTKSKKASLITNATSINELYQYMNYLPLNSPKDLSLYNTALYLSINYHGSSISHYKPKSLSQVIVSLNLSGLNIIDLPDHLNIPSLTYVELSHNNLTSIASLRQCTNIIELSLDWNNITSLEDVANLTQLQQLSLSHNKITSLFGVNYSLASLWSLNLDYNFIESLEHINALVNLTDLSLAYNSISQIKEMFKLKSLAFLITLNIRGVPLCNENKDMRNFSLYHLPYIKCFDDELVKQNEMLLARETYGGKLTLNNLGELLGHTNFNNISELTLSSQGIRSFDIVPIATLENLRSLNLENNLLTNLSGLVDLDNLRILCLNNNKIASLDTTTDNTYPIMVNLEVLILANNGIVKLAPLQLNRLISLKALFLQNNEINSLEGVGSLNSLKELVLDKNKIKSLCEHELVGLSFLLELHIEENRLKSLPELTNLSTLHRLFLGYNRIYDIKELEKLIGMEYLVEVSFISNPISRKGNYTTSLIQLIPSLQAIDGFEIPPEERAKALDDYSNWSNVQ